MGGRGASSGRSITGKEYGTEFETIYQSGNIKFVRYNDSTAAKSPMETMTSGRVYVTLSKDEYGNFFPKYITYYDKHNRRFKQIDISGKPHMIDGKPELPHTHNGYWHDEKGTKKPNPSERKMIERALKTWQNRIR